jgi:hypothetical protein
MTQSTRLGVRLNILASKRASLAGPRAHQRSTEDGHVPVLLQAELRAMTDGFKERIQGRERPAPRGRGGSG